MEPYPKGVEDPEFARQMGANMNVFQMVGDPRSHLEQLLVAEAAAAHFMSLPMNQGAINVEQQVAAARQAVDKALNSARASNII